MTKQEKAAQSRQLFAGIALLLVAVILYLYFLNLSVVHVVMRKEAVREQNHLRTEIAMLETKYIESQHLIAARIATLDGYNVQTNKVFIARGGTETLVLNTN